MATQDKFELNRVRIEDEKVDSNSTDITVFGVLSVIMGVVGGWIKLERK